MACSEVRGSKEKRMLDLDRGILLCMYGIWGIHSKEKKIVFRLRTIPRLEEPSL